MVRRSASGVEAAPGPSERREGSRALPPRRRRRSFGEDAVMADKPESSRARHVAAAGALLLAAGAVVATTVPALGPASSTRSSAASGGDAAPAPTGRRVVATSDGSVTTRARSRRARARVAVPPRRRIASARRFLAARAGQTAFAVVDSRGRLTGLRSDEQFSSASVVKAMLLVARLDALDRAGTAPGAGERALLGAMVRRSDNRAADAIYARVGDAGLMRLARRARMRRFGAVGYWANARVTPADQARFFLRLDPLLPRRQRAYGRGLLSGVVAEQSWGIPRAGRPRWRVFFKGGWRPEAGGYLVHQAARLERGERVVAVAVMTRANPSHYYGTETVRGVALRLLRG